MLEEVGNLVIKINSKGAIQVTYIDFIIGGYVVN